MASKMTNIKSAVSENINLKILGPNNSKVPIQIRKDTTLLKIKIKYHTHTGIPIENLIFMYEGQMMNEADTFLSMNMKDGDIIEAYVFQIGG